MFPFMQELRAFRRAVLDVMRVGGLPGRVHAFSRSAGKVLGSPGGGPGRQDDMFTSGKCAWASGNLSVRLCLCWAPVRCCGLRVFVLVRNRNVRPKPSANSEFGCDPSDSNVI